MSSFTVHVTQGDTGAVVWFAGELDIASAPLVRQCLSDLSGESITLDFSNVTFMDSTALGVLIAAHDRAEQDGGTIELTGVQPVQMRVLEITGLVEYLDPQSATPSDAASSNATASSSTERSPATSTPPAERHYADVPREARRRGFHLEQVNRADRCVFVWTGSALHGLDVQFDTEADAFTWMEQWLERDTRTATGR